MSISSMVFHTVQVSAREDDVLSVQLLPEKVIKLNKIEETQNIQAQGWQERMLFFFSMHIMPEKRYKAETNQGNTIHPSTPLARKGDVIFRATSAKKSYEAKLSQEGT